MPGLWQSRPVDPAVVTALIAELGRKTSVCWLRYSVYDGPVREHAVWHVWYDNALLLVSGGSEQPLPDIEDVTSVEVTMRSKDNGGRLVSWVGTPSRVLPAEEGWDGAVGALATARLSIPSLTETPRIWATESVVTRIDPTGELIEEPGSLADASRAAVPRPTPATTRGPLPRILHRRQRRRPHLS
jgi:hypothetical protein